VPEARAIVSAEECRVLIALDAATTIEEVNQVLADTRSATVTR
jgi:hypothetical protein